MNPLSGVIFDYGNTLVRLDPSARSTRTDYADVVAGPGAERLAAFLLRAGTLEPSRVAVFVERFLEVRERNRGRAERERREIPALRSLEETLRAMGLEVPGEAELGRAVEEYFLAEVELIRPMPGSTELLEGLRGRGFRLALLSNATSGPYVREVVRRMGWSEVFDPLVVSAEIGIRKPSPEAFRAVLDRWDLEPREIAMVGDSLLHDVAPGLSLGLVAIHFRAIPNAFDAGAADVRATHTVTTLDELLPLLE